MLFLLIPIAGAAAGGLYLRGDRGGSPAKSGGAPQPRPGTKSWSIFDGNFRSQPTDGGRSNRATNGVKKIPPIAEAPKDAQAEDKQLNQEMALSAMALGLTKAGALVAHPLGLLGLPIVVKLAIPYWREGYRSLVKERKVDGNVRDAVLTGGLIAAGLFSLAAVAEGTYALSKKIILRTRRRSEGALIGAFSEQPRTVWIVAPGGEEVEIPFVNLKPGDECVVSGGQRIPADGVITQGAGAVDRHMLTGESQPVESGAGDPVFASTLVLSGQIRLRVERSGEETAAAQISQILRNTADYPSSVALWGKQFSDRAAIPMLALGAAAIPFGGVQGALAVLLSDVTWDARLTGPLSVLSYLKLATEQGILIKDGRALELLSKVNTVVFDKTGTLTLEQPELGRIFLRDGMEENQLLRYAASAESRQTHPIARAILQAAQARRLDLSSCLDAHYEAGFGILVQLAGKRVHVGSARYMEMEAIEIPADWRSLQAAGHGQGYSYVYVALDGSLGGMIELRPAIRPEVKELVRRLRARKLSIYILSGDHEQATSALAKQLGIEHYFAEVLPAGKAEIIERLQSDGASICFAGDGINDAIALKKAHVSVSLHGASTVAADAASIILMDGNLERLGRLFEVADGLSASQRRNLVTSIVPGTVAVGGVFLFHLGIWPALMLCLGGNAVGITNAMLPRLPPGKGREKQRASISDEISRAAARSHAGVRTSSDAAGK